MTQSPVVETIVFGWWFGRDDECEYYALRYVDEQGKAWVAPLGSRIDEPWAWIPDLTEDAGP